MLTNGETKASHSERDKEEVVLNYPLVSIITPVFNGKKYLEACLQSVLNQSYPRIEHIFVDGGSTDGTLNILSSYQSRYPERIIFISGPDRGVGEAVNKGLAIARGQIFGWIDSDDLYKLDAISAAVEFFRENPDAYFLFGGCNMIDEKGEVISSFTIKDFNLREALNRWHYIVFCATFFKREVVESIGLLNTLGNDLDFYIRVHKAFRMHRIEETLSSWRLHSEGISLSQKARGKSIRRERVKEDFLLCLKHGGSIFSPRSMRYYVTVLSPIINGLRPILGRHYPFIKRCLGMGELYQ